MIQMQAASRLRSRVLERPTVRPAQLTEITPDVACLRNLLVNLYFIGQPQAGADWVLVDTGLPYSASRIRQIAERRFGYNTRPRAIILTHGHFDHVGGVRDLAESWDVPVYAHELEMPYLTGLSAYPPPDPSVGGALAWVSVLYPRGPIDLGRRVQPFADGKLPFLDDWTWVHTPGHTPGHVSFFREEDRVLLAGDAVCTMKQESLTHVLARTRGVFGPPACYTTDWSSAWASVQRLARLHPAIIGPGHGRPLKGPETDDGLQRLARDFDRIAIPRRGRYVRQPAVADKTGVVYVPPRTVSPALIGALAFGVAATGLAVYAAQRRRRTVPTIKRRLARASARAGRLFK